MDQNELMRMLDLKPKQVRQEIVITKVTVPKGPIAVETYECSETVLACNDWDRSQGRRLLTNLVSRQGGLPDNDRYAYVDAAADFYTAAFNAQPEFEMNPIDKQREQFVKDLMESSDYQVLRESTVGNVNASDLAATEFLKSCLKLEEQRRQQSEKEKASGKAPDQDALDVAGLKAVNAALDAAIDKVDRYEETCKAAGMDTNGQSELDANRIKDQFERLQNDAMLRRIMELAGRYRRVAQAKQRTKVTHGQDEMVGVTLGDEVSRLLPVELAKLASPALQLDTMRRLVERQCQVRECKGIEKQGKGPIVVCVDESGSMSGEPIANAKAFALAMAWIAKHQNRPILLASFSFGTQTHMVCIKPKDWSTRFGEVLEWLKHFYCGGTSLDVPLNTVPNKWEQLVKEGFQKGKTDQIIITDAEVNLSWQLRDRYLKWKKEQQVRTITIVMGADAGCLRDVSDEVYPCSGISVDHEAIGRCFSI